MKFTKLTTALLLVTSACGVVVEPTEDPAPTPGGPTFEEPPLTADFPLPAAPTLPLIVDDARGALTPQSLFDISYVKGVLPDVVNGDVDVLEQRIHTIDDSEVELTIELAPPKGTFQRTLVSDAFQNGGTYTDQVLCESNGFATYDPRCETAAPPLRAMPSDGPIAADWTLRVESETSGAIARCTDAGPNKLTCVLPAQANASYRIVASTSGFAGLWDGSATFGKFMAKGTPFFGGFATQSEWRCWDWRYSGSSAWCAARYEYVRFTALESARIDLEPMTVTLSAGDASAARATEALSWDPGTYDVPGPY